MPTVRRATAVDQENPEFAALYKDIISDRLTIFYEEIIRIADDASRDFRDVVRHGRPTESLMEMPSLERSCVWRSVEAP